jgi:hypothetical protein
METQTLKQECSARGIMIVAPLPFVTKGWSYVGVFPPARTWDTENDACLAALAHYRAIQPQLFGVPVEDF